MHMGAFVSSIFSHRLRANIFSCTVASKFTFVVIRLNTSFQMFSGKYSQGPVGQLSFISALLVVLIDHMHVLISPLSR